MRRGDDGHGPDDLAARSDAGRTGGSSRGRASGSSAGLGVFTPPPVVRGLVAGAIAALTIRQGALLLASLADLAPPPSFALKAGPGQPLPQAASAALWGAFWGSLLALLLPRRDRGRRYWLAGLLLGAAL